MQIQDCVTVSEACVMLQTYHQLLIGLAKRHGVAIERVGRFQFISRKGIETLRPHVRAWHDRPRLIELAAAAAS
jgi:hypothetical protein